MGQAERVLNIELLTSNFATHESDYLEERSDRMQVGREFVSHPGLSGFEDEEIPHGSVPDGAFQNGAAIHVFGNPEVR